MLDPAGMCWACRAGAGPVQEGPMLLGLPRHQEQESWSYFHQQHAAGDTHCWAVSDPGHHTRPWLCSSGWALQDGTMLGRALPCPSPSPSAPSSPALACQGAVWWAHSATSFFKMQGQFLARLLSRCGWKAMLHRTTLRHDCSVHPGTWQHILACALSQRSNANRDLEKGLCACELSHFSNYRKSCKDQKADPN